MGSLVNFPLPGPQDMEAAEGRRMKIVAIFMVGG